jgi:hypothetical protein
MNADGLSTCLCVLTISVPSCSESIAETEESVLVKHDKPIPVWPKECVAEWSRSGRSAGNLSV